MKVAGVFYGVDRSHIFDKVFQELERREYKIEPIAITFERKTETLIKESSLSYKNKNFVKYCYEKGLYKEPDMQYLRKKEYEYNHEHISLNWLLFSERYIRIYNKFTYKQAMRILELNFRFIEELFDTEKPEILLTGQIASLMDYICWFEAKKRNIKFRSYVADRISDSVLISDCPANIWNKFLELINETKQWNSIPDKVRMEIKSFLKKFSEGNIRAICLKEEKKILPIFKFLRYYKRRGFNKYRDFTNIPILYKLFNKIKEKTRIFLLRGRIEFIREIKEQNYIFFPLHLEPETTTLYWAPFYFENQMAFAENIAKALPIGWYLFIKENPRMIGCRDLYFYEYLSQFSNIKFVSNNISSLELIKRSQAVVTITGTAALEAAFLGKPSFIFGDVFFEYCPGVYRIKKWEDIDEVIRKKIKNFNYNEDELIKFTWAYLKSLHKGIFTTVDDYPSTLSDENIKNLTDVFIESI